ncbi:MAG: hypothetical protein Tsb0021_13750 [Chlamydiales bacterium]
MISEEVFRNLFSSISGSIITATTMLVSITVLVFTVLSGQFGAHTLRVVKIKTFNKFVIGWGLGTYIYILTSVLISAFTDRYIPQITILFGIIFTFMTFLLLIIYLHVLLNQIQSESIIYSIYSETHSKIKELREYTNEEQKMDELFIKKYEKKGLPVVIEKSGYVQTIDKKKLIEIAKHYRCIIHVLYRSGKYLIQGIPSVLFYELQKADIDLKESLNSCFTVGDQRIPVEDLEYNLEVLVEMTLRALSPGINDMYVAYHTIDNIMNVIAQITHKKFPDRVHFDREGQLRLIINEFTFSGFVDAALSPIRQNGKEHPGIILRMLDHLFSIIENTKIPDYQIVLIEHVEAILQSQEEIKHVDLDQKAINERRSHYQNLMAAYQSM